jgi:hypothetical protein
VAKRPHHRVWLHALEDDRSVPDYAMQAARVYADFAARSNERGVHVSFRMLLRCTHMWRNRAGWSVAWLRDHGWLETAECGNGKKSFYHLTIPVEKTDQLV